MTRALVVVAHPDDLEMYLGGAVAIKARDGWEFIEVIVTNGEKGVLDGAVSMPRVIETRRREQQASSELLGVREVIYLAHPDGEVSPSPLLQRQLAELIRKVRPDKLYTFDPWKPYDMQFDHTAVGMAALRARLAAKLPLQYREQIDEGLSPWATPEIFLFGTQNANAWIDISSTFELKMRALMKHESQFGGWEGPTRQNMEKEARAAGLHLGVRYAEAFKHIIIEGIMVLDNLGE